MAVCCASLYEKMNDIVCLMQDPVSGVPVKTQKHFRTFVPMSFTGIEAIEWLRTFFNTGDALESIQLASLLCQCGYIFPVIEKTLTVKEDSTLFRFQAPYFWPSVNNNPDNVEYAIHLTKRLMRNELKHGLEDYEADAYTKLRELLAHMWDFINTQAEMQLKIFKERKKVEKVVLDSQERSFWNLRRPPPGTVSIFEERYGKAEKVLKKRTAKDYQHEIERCKFALKTKPWLKSPKCLETLVSWCDHFRNMIRSCLTANLEIPGHVTIPRNFFRLWTLNADACDVPTWSRVKRWGFSIQELVRDSLGRQVLETFLESEFSSENIKFWIAVQDLKSTPRLQVPEKVDSIYNEFLNAGAPSQVNVDSRTLEAVRAAMQDARIPPRFCFSEAEEHIFVLMSKDSYPRFVRSEIYKGILSAAQQQGGKRLGIRNLFGNVGGGAKKGSTTGATQSTASGAAKPNSSPSPQNVQLQSSGASPANTTGLTRQGTTDDSKSANKNSKGKSSDGNQAYSIERPSSSTNLPSMSETEKSISEASSDHNIVTPWDQK